MPQRDLTDAWVAIGNAIWHGKQLIWVDRRARDSTNKVLFDYRVTIDRGLPLRYYHSFIASCLHDNAGAAYKQAAAVVRAAMLDHQGRFVIAGHEPAWIVPIIKAKEI